MNQTSTILSVLLTLTLVVLIAPNILAMNRGKTLRNIALWLAICLVLGLVYQTFGPLGSSRPLFGRYGTPLRDNNDNSPSHTQENRTSNEDKMPPAVDDNDKDDDTTSKGDQGFNPPRE